MSEIFVLIEHRQGVIRDISYELPQPNLTK